MRNDLSMYVFEPNHELREKMGLWLEDNLLCPSDQGVTQIFLQNSGKVARELKPTDTLGMAEVCLEEDLRWNTVNRSPQLLMSIVVRVWTGERP